MKTVKKALAPKVNAIKKPVAKKPNPIAKAPRVILEEIEVIKVPFDELKDELQIGNKEFPTLEDEPEIIDEVNELLSEEDDNSVDGQ